MTIVEIGALENGGHRNQTGNFMTVPEGWAVIPPELATENFPFGDVTAELINDVMTVTAWTPGDIPAPEPVPVPDPEYVTYEELAAAIREGVNSL